MDVIPRRCIVKHSSDLIKLAVALLDLSLITAAFFLAYFLRFDHFRNIDKLIWLYYFAAPLILVMLLRYRVMTGFRHRSLRKISGSTLFAFIVAGTIASTVLYLTKTSHYSRLLFVYFFGLSAIFILAEKALLKSLWDRHLRRGGQNVRVAMVGYGPKFDAILTQISSARELGVTPVEVIDPRTVTSDIIARTVREAVIDEVYIAYPLGSNYSQEVDNLLQRLEKLGVTIRLALNYDEFEDYYGQYFCKMGGKDGILIAPYNLDPDQLIIKRLIDIGGSALGLSALAIIAPFVALAIKLDSKGPVLYRQRRIGKNGREFTIYKFRSMNIDADLQKAQLLTKNIHRGPIFKLENDPRVTRIGHFLRRTHLDEFPQFWNVLIGDMSLVGTRPPTVEEVLEYEDHHHRRLSIIPGLTGIWQVSGRNSIRDFDDIVALDLEYIRNWSIWLDLKIILVTIYSVLVHRKTKGL